MKTLKLCGIAALLLSLNALNAQTPGTTMTGTNTTYHPWEVGLRFMPTFSSFDVRTSSGVIQSELTLGYGWGGLVGYNFTEHVGLQLEGIYSSMSQKYRDQSLDRVVHLNYMNFPLLFSANTGKGAPVNLNFVVGPQFGFNVGSKLETSGTPDDGVEQVDAVLAVKAGDVGVAYGAGLEFGFGESRQWHADLGFRGVYGLLDISDRSKTTTTDQYYVLDRAHVRSYAGYIGLTYAF